MKKMDRAGADCDRRDRFCFPASAFKSGADVVSYIQGHRISVTGYRSESECVRNPPVRARFYAGGSGWQVWNGKGAELFLPEIKFFRTAVLYLRIVFATGIENVLLYDYAAAAAHSGTAWLRGEPEAEKYFNSTCGDRMSGVFFVVFKNGIRKRDARASL